MTIKLIRECYLLSWQWKQRRWWWWRKKTGWKTSNKTVSKNQLIGTQLRFNFRLIIIITGSELQVVRCPLSTLIYMVHLLIIYAELSRDDDFWSFRISHWEPIDRLHRRRLIDQAEGVWLNAYCWMNEILRCISFHAHDFTHWALSLSKWCGKF